MGANRSLPNSVQGTAALPVIILLIFSGLFYSAWNPTYFGLLVWVAAVDYKIALRIYAAKTDSKRKFLLILSLSNSLGILFFFKYFGFFQENLLETLHILGLSAHFEIIRILLPVGISFYVFQSVSYIVDVYRRNILPEKNLSHYLLFLSFFPQLVAGPIVNAKSFLPQLKNLLPFSEIRWNFALFLILLGAFKKVVIADHLAITSDFSFSHVGEVNREFLWIGLLSYAGQIYCDFSGYTDIAQGTALMFGFELPENFRMPYLARGFSDFWRRWHISLSDWLKNYLYIPLGGNRAAKLGIYKNLMVVMLLGGLWHGANWNFLFWGAGHGFLLVCERLVRNLNINTKYLEIRLLMPIYHFMYTALTFLCVCFLWVFFRSQNFSDSLCYLQGLFVKNADISIPYAQLMTTYWCFFAMIVGHIIGQKIFKNNESLSMKFDAMEQTAVKKIALGALYSLGFIAVVLMSGNALPFVYFVF
ncbi:MAG: MBOAT family O-acyltransferase [Leptospira sp.]|nr:MBOAT family O-acyltransferase [Leptospira sp.]